jgi:predicted nucleic acid-binding protein
LSTFVLDCSITMSWCFEDEASPQSDRLLDRLRDHGALVPALWFWEVANVLNAALRHGRVSAADVSARLRLLTALPISTRLA